jgi:hypothetical protein
MKIINMEVSFPLGSKISEAIEESIINTIRNKCNTKFWFNDELFEIFYNDVVSSYKKN